ncbi:hypothetical protein J8641_11010 [Neisseria elongata subsp. nitroreducens]|uniref:Uncharacterized protein n=1 Tax=Neisseria elongata subsp. nitroreducens TaxID=90367 RepID=A0A9X0ZYF2_NEIEL|nr:hypothetical protein [Neisseria elongata subsp. nitroreducens]
MLKEKGTRQDFDFIVKQNGIVFLLRLDTWTRGRLKSEFAIYAVRSGRINVAGINRQY